MTIVALTAACGPRTTGPAAPDSTWTPPPLTVPASGDRVTDVFAASLTPAQQEDIEDACFDAQGVPTFGEGGCKVAIRSADWKPCLTTDELCFLVGQVADKTDQAFVRVVAPRATQSPCPTEEELCRGVLTERSTHDTVRRAVQAAASSQSPPSTETSEGSTDTPTPTDSSTELTETPDTTTSPARTASSKGTSSESPNTDDSDGADESDPPVEEQ